MCNQLYKKTQFLAERCAEAEVKSSGEKMEASVQQEDNRCGWTTLGDGLEDA